MAETSVDSVGNDVPTGFASAASLVKRVDELQRQRDEMERQWK